MQGGVSTKAYCLVTFLVNGPSDAITENPLMEMYQNRQNYDENRRRRIQRQYRNAYRKSKVKLLRKT